MQVPVELKIKYLERRRVDIDHLISSLEDDDFGPAIKLGHQVKGNAGTFEFPQMAPIGLEIETAAKNQDKNQILMLVQRMSSEIHSASLTFH
jgi:HPt (histidine-containing phosphotransfer) domain-containing protein